VCKRKVDVINGIGTICSALPDKYLLVAAQQSGAMSLDWAMRTFEPSASSADYAAVNAAVEKSPPGARGLIYTPWLLGECVPRTIAGNRAEFFHLSADHDRGDMYRAIMEGVALNIRWAQKAVNRHIAPHGQLRAFGGGTRSQVWCQILADCLQLPVVQMEQPHLAGVYGAAMLASVALGWYGSLAEATVMARQKRIFDPDITTSSHYEEAFGQFLNLYHQQKKLSSP
ncbi:MAG TPA: FGGY-family carbohydrate kinase, partial [Gammaproteobacteria bacterium]|nr:FGGY-family carbohydrate kinase [Gammaproteobacteria bacterium]